MKRQDVLLILDTNILVLALASAASPSAKILDACTRRELPYLLSRPVLDEYRQVLHYPQIRERHLCDLDLAALDLVIRKVYKNSQFISPVTARFRFDRDPRDERFIELAIQGGATHIVTCDLDLLSMRTAHSLAAKQLRRRLRTTQMMKPDELLKAIGPLE